MTEDFAIANTAYWFRWELDADEDVDDRGRREDCFLYMRFILYLSTLQTWFWSDFCSFIL